ncbi:hypothetical protein Pcac1_g28606 [Phytophthora cactorum]|nr:hypothetical protein Pcac1_g28606 [Phytophthora cactorum]
MDLLEAIRKEVLKQKEEEALNFFSTVSDFREFITTAKPATDVSVTVKMTYWMSEWVNGDHGTRVTLIDANQRAFFDSTVEALGELTVVKRKPYIAQIMVWDDKANKGVSGFGSKPGMMFRPGAVYVFHQVDGVGFYADIAKGSVQFEVGNAEKIVEVAASIAKRKVSRAVGKKKAKAKTQHVATSLTSEPEEEGEGDVVMEADNNEPDDAGGVRTRSNIPTPP